LAAESEEVGDGSAASGEIEGEAAGVEAVSGVAVGVGSGVAVGLASGVAVDVLCGVAWGSGVGDWVGVVRGDIVAIGVELTAGDGELAGWPPVGPAGCWSHPATKRLAKATVTTRDLIMPENTDARARGIFKARYE
jgi:hypothetical protein